MPFVRLASFVLLIGLVACSSTRPFVDETYQEWESTPRPPDSELEYQVFLLGDAGDAESLESSAVLSLLHRQLGEAGEEAAVVFLGDNAYCCGLVDSAQVDRRRSAENRLMAQINAVKEFDGRILFLPGNHDWNDSRPGGLEGLERMEDFIQDSLDRGNVFKPDDGFPGPEEIKLTKRVTLIAIDTEWWLTKHERSLGDAGPFDIEEDGDFLVQMEDVINSHRNDHLLIVAHHPLQSNGLHAGRFPLKTHLFPLTEVVDNAYLPLPVLGSLAALYIRHFGTRQDLGHHRYRALREALESLMEEHESIIFAAGHDHSLQYFDGPVYTSILSGSASKVSYAAPGRGAAFVASEKGYARLFYYKNGAIWMEMWAPNADGSDGRILFRTEVKGPARDAIDPDVPPPPSGGYPDYRDSTYTLPANAGYTRSGLFEALAGKHNRDIWAIPITVPYLDLGNDAGGLTPVKRGGGMQTFSLRLQGGDGYEYSLRSIDKDPSVSIPEPLRETFARDAVQDQIASIHPYGAFMIPRLAKAAGIAHAEPRLVYVPDDPRLGIYREQFARRLMMIEVRPDDDMTEFPSFGEAEDVMSAESFYEEITHDNDHRVDAEAFVRARLFDMLLSDWDRHRLQWRWAAYEPEDGQGKIYRPIPKDRDWAFNRFDGLLPGFMRFAIDPKFQQFTPNFANVKGLTFNGYEQDRRLTNSVTLDTWLAIAHDLQSRIDDATIESAISALPVTVFDHHGEELIATLKSRLAQLPDAAEVYYQALAARVDVVGSYKHEKFVVDRLDDGAIRVTMIKTTKKGEERKQLYQRTFTPNETKEIVLYGLAGNDQFISRGDGASRIRIHVVGGSGEDRLQDDVTRSATGRKIAFYDTPDGTEFEDGPSTLIKLSNDPNVHRYEQKGYKHDSILPRLYFGVDRDDGLFLGGGFALTKYGFRKKPYASQQVVMGNLAPESLAYNLIYRAHVVDLFGSLDLVFDTHFSSAGNTQNYYGFGNTTPELGDREFHRVRFARNLANLDLLLGEPEAQVSFGLHLAYYDVEVNRQLFDTLGDISPLQLSEQWIGGVHVGIELNDTDRPFNPLRGFHFAGRAGLNAGLEQFDDVYSDLSASLAFYASPSTSPQVTWATRIGGARLLGDFPFYDASTLGGRQNLRGWRSTRFAGRSSLYGNTELRLRFLQFSNYIALGEMGLLGFFDTGRVWADQDSTPGKTWHTGYGGGLWVSLFEAVVINGTVGVSEEETAFSVRTGFLF